MRVNIHGLIDNAKCHQMVRQLRWPEGVECPHCHAAEVARNGHDETRSVDGMGLFAPNRLSSSWRVCP
ncbi:MAG TPA: hypothetical protein DEB39_10850 [Planctomycetaceae bacterium]|nr:hypothetical protein [Planctomycetaceae bacterium]